jgi:type 1 fimbria pilin
MKLSRRWITGLLGLAASCQSYLVMAAPNTCTWRTTPGPITFSQVIGTVFVPRDAPAGSIIGSSLRLNPSNNEGASILCDNDGRVRLTFNAQASVPFVQGSLHAMGGQIAPDTVLQTNIPGVGARIVLGFPFDNSATNAFIPDAGDSKVPFTAHHERPMGSALLNFSRLEGSITLVKTGDIAPGPQTLNGQELFNGSFSGIAGKAFGLELTGTVIQAHCGSNRVSADPVPLGNWDISDFTGPGHTTTAVPFNIILSSCVADDRDINIATVNIRFEGANGSVPVTPPIPGVFSLTQDSEAEGVGIQILRADGSTPIELDTEVALQPITVGDTVLDFTARFYQTGASRDLVPGTAKGALSFTLTYN